MAKEKQSWMFDSLEEAYLRTGKQMLDFSMFPDKDLKHMENYYHLITLHEAVNENDVFDWDNWDQYKYTSWWNMSASAFRFDGADCDDTYADAGSGSRLRVLKREKAEWLAEKFPEIFKEVQIG